MLWRWLFLLVDKLYLNLIILGGGFSYCGGHLRTNFGRHSPSGKAKGKLLKNNSYKINTCRICNRMNNIRRYEKKIHTHFKSPQNTCTTWLDLRILCKFLPTSSHSVMEIQRIESLQLKSIADVLWHTRAPVAYNTVTIVWTLIKVEASNGRKSKTCRYKCGKNTRSYCAHSWFYQKH